MENQEIKIGFGENGENDYESEIIIRDSFKKGFHTLTVEENGEVYYQQTRHITCYKGTETFLDKFLQRFTPNYESEESKITNRQRNEKNMEKPEILGVTMIDFHEENITKKDLLKKLQEALDNFTECETLHSITLRAVVRVNQKPSLEQKIASVLSRLIQDADSACD